MVEGKKSPEAYPRRIGVMKKSTIKDIPIISKSSKKKQ